MSPVNEITGHLSVLTRAGPRRRVSVRRPIQSGGGRATTGGAVELKRPRRGRTGAGEERNCGGYDRICDVRWR